MKFIKDAKTISTDDPYYDLMEGGYLNPLDFLVEKDAMELIAAIKLIKLFLDEAEENGVIEIL